LDLESRLCRALDLAKRAVELFGATGYTDAPYNSFGPEKVVTEAAMLVYAAWGARTLPRVAGLADELAALLAQYARNGRVLRDIALHPSRVAKLVVAHVILSRLGYPDRAFDAVARSRFYVGEGFRIDYPPSAVAERVWLRSLWRSESTETWIDTNGLTSILDAPAELVDASREDAYGFTHLLFYLTDFGYRSHPDLVRAQTTIVNEAECLIARCLDGEDYDLAGELLMTWPLLGAPWSPGAAFAFRVLASVEDEAGLLPCGHVDVTRLEGLDGDERVRYALGTAYHTAFVMGFLCALCLRGNNAPPARFADRSYELSRVTALAPFLDHDQGHWQQLLAECDESEQAMLLPFLCQIAMVQKLRKQEYETMKNILLLTIEAGLENQLLWDQAANLLLGIAESAPLIHRYDTQIVTE
jgi:hypothetical protein